MTAWTVQLTMSSPTVLSPRAPLVGDALLSAAEARRRWGGQTYQRHPFPGSDWVERLPLPIAEEKNHWAVSQVEFHGQITRMADRLYKTVDSRIASPKEQSSGPLKAAIHEYIAWWIPVLTFDVDVEYAQNESFQNLVTRFLPRITVGAMGRIGFGQIAHVALRPRNPSVSAVWHDGSQPRRPLRLTVMPEGWLRDPAKTVLFSMRAEPPRWYGPKEWCAVPHPITWMPRTFSDDRRHHDIHEEFPT